MEPSRHDRNGTLALVFALTGLVVPIVGLIVVPFAIVFARRSRRELGYRSGRAIFALVLACATVALLILAGALYLFAIWIGHANFG